LPQACGPAAWLPQEEPPQGELPPASGFAALGICGPHVNVRHIYIWASETAGQVKPEAPHRFSSPTSPRLCRYNSTPASSRSSADIGNLLRDGSARTNSEAMPCDIAQICKAIISDGGRWPSGKVALSTSAASRSTAKARLPAD